MKYLLLAAAFVCSGFMLVFFTVLGLIAPSFPLLFVAYGLSTAGLAMGIVRLSGVASHG